MRCLIPFIAIILASSEVAADTIRLRGSVRVPHHEHVVRLRHIAELEGEHARALGHLVMADLPRPGEVRELSIGDVRQRLDAEGVHWGRVHLDGRRTVVRGRIAADAALPLAMQSISLQEAPASTTTPTASPRREAGFVPATSLVAMDTLRGELARRIAHELAVPPAELQLRFPNENDEALDTSVNDYRLEIAPLGRWDAPRINVSARAWRDGRPVNRWLLRVDARVHREVPVAARDLGRRQVLTAQDFEMARRWVSPADAATLVTPEEATGRLTSRWLRAGELLVDSTVTSPTVVHRGDQVMVRCRVGGLALAVKGEAQADGAVGDRIEVRKLGERENIVAVVVSPGEVVVELN